MGTHAMEALLGVIIIFSSIGLLLSRPISEDFSTLGKIAYGCISYLDASGGLREAAVGADAESINREIISCIPASLESHVSVCSATCSKPAGKKGNVVNARYILYGNGVDFKPTEILVSVWRK